MSTDGKGQLLEGSAGNEFKEGEDVVRDVIHLVFFVQQGREPVEREGSNVVRRGRFNFLRGKNHA